MAMSNAKLAASLPKGDANGLGAIASELVADPQQIRVALVLLDVGELATATDDGTVTAKVRIKRIETIRNNEDAFVLRKLLQREFERRTGQTVLPFDLQQDVEDAFEGFTPGAEFPVQPTLDDPGPQDTTPRFENPGD